MFAEIAQTKCQQTECWTVVRVHVFEWSRQNNVAWMRNVCEFIRMMQSVAPLCGSSPTGKHFALFGKPDASTHTHTHTVCYSTEGKFIIGFWVLLINNDPLSLSKYGTIVETYFGSSSFQMQITLHVNSTVKAGLLSKLAIHMQSYFDVDYRLDTIFFVRFVIYSTKYKL